MSQRPQLLLKSAMDLLFEVTQDKMGSHLENLKSKDEYLSQESCDDLAIIRQTCYYLWSDANYQKISSRLVDFMLQQGLAQLIVKIVKSFGKVTAEFREDAGLVITHLVVNMKDTNQSECDKVQVELIKCGIIDALVEQLNTYDPNTNDPKQRLLILGTLYDLSNMRSAPNVIPIYRAANAVDVLMKFAEADDVPTRIDSLRVLSFIVNEKESERIAASGECIKTLLNIVQLAAESEGRECNYVLNIGDGEREFSTTLGAALETTNNLANNDANKAAIVQHGGLPILTAILRPEYADDEKWRAVTALWKLSFLDSNVDLIRTHLTSKDTAAMQVLKEMKSSRFTEILHASQGLLYQLSLLAIQEEESPVEQNQQQSASASSSVRPRAQTAPPIYQEPIDLPNVMITYNSDQQERAIKVRDELLKNGCNTWLAVDKQGDNNSLVDMANSVKKADAVLMCLSRAYKESPNCQAEANYAFKQQKPIIPLMVEENYDPDGWLLGILTAVKNCIRAYNDEVLDKDMPNLMQELRKCRGAWK